MNLNLDRWSIILLIVCASFHLGFIIGGIVKQSNILIHDTDKQIIRYENQLYKLIIIDEDTNEN